MTRVTYPKKCFSTRGDTNPQESWAMSEAVTPGRPPQNGHARSLGRTLVAQLATSQQPGGTVFKQRVQLISRGFSLLAL